MELFFTLLGLYFGIIIFATAFKNVNSFKTMIAYFFGPLIYIQISIHFSYLDSFEFLTFSVIGMVSGLISFELSEILKKRYFKI